MKPLYVYTIFDPKSGKPRCTGIKDGSKVIISDLYQGLKGNPLQPIMERITKINELLMKSERVRPLVIVDFKKHIQAFSLNFNTRRVNVYNLSIPKLPIGHASDKDRQIVTKVLNKVSCHKPQYYQKVHANAEIVYNDLEVRGLEINHNPFFPKWSTDTFSGRSKTTGTNIQGWSENALIRPPGYNEHDVLIHFDWICADIRVASLLSKDSRLKQAFAESDPYQKMMEVLNENSDDKITRDECKMFLLKSINSMDFTSVVLTDVYPQLGKWIRKCKEIAESGEYLQTLLNRKFRVINAKNELAVLNGVMQGSVAHAMQCALRRTWELYPSRVVAEIHDSMVVASSSNPAELKSVINSVSNIMLRPFDGILKSNPVFPVKVSIGKEWKTWKPVYIYRKDGKENVRKENSPQRSETQKEEKEEI